MKKRKQSPSFLLLNRSIEEIKSLRADKASTKFLARRFEVSENTMRKFLNEIETKSDKIEEIKQILEEMEG